MKINEFIQPLSGKKGYNIYLSYNEDIVPFDLAESIKLQYPKALYSITYAKITKIEIGMIFGGINLK